MMNLDTWGLDDRHWTNVRRIHWNRPAIMSPGLSRLIDAAPDMPIQVNPSEIVEDQQDNMLVRDDVDYAWIAEFYRHVYPGIDPDEQLQEEMAAVEEAFRFTGRVTLLFPTTLLLATRR